MAAATGRETADLIGRLLAKPQSFSLGQALRLLGQAHSATPEERHSFLLRRVRIRPWLSLAFPPGDLVALEEDEDGAAFELTATGFGLYSTLGPLPTLYTEELLDEVRRDESVSRDFLDILNNHLYHLHYGAWHHNRLERRTVESHKRDADHIQFCLMGQADPSLREPGPPRAFLAELLARRARSAGQMGRYLGYVLERDDVDIEQCVERRAPIPLGQRCRLGEANARLGEDAMLGCELRDSVGKFRIHLREVAPEDMPHFLPGRPGHEALARHILRFLDAPLEYDLILHPAPGPQPQVRVGEGRALGFYLGTAERYPAVRVLMK